MNSLPRALTRAELDKIPHPPVESGDKHDHGRFLLIAGSRDVPGSALLAATAAMRAGAGKLKIATVASAAPGLRTAMPEALVVGLAEARDGGFARSAIKPLAELAGDVDAVAAGPGMMGNAAAERLAAALCRSGRPVALDAALLRVLPKRRRAAEEAAIPPILLPHAGEMATLLGCDESEVEADRLACGRRCAAEYDAVTLVKGAQSHVVTPDGRAWKHEGGGPGLGVSGSGDTLAGIVGGLLARGAEPLTALLWAVWLHGEAGAALSRKFGKVGFLARELPGEIPALLPS
jgi:hydroxyethylthiazole kinase-like uncharacterized protein yjeF